MRYYLLVFLLNFSTHAVELDKLIDTNIKVILDLKDFKKQKDRIGVLQSEVSILKKNTKLSDKDFYVVTDFLKVLDSISLIDKPSVENCFNTKIGILSDFGVRSVDMSEKNLPDGVKKGLLILKVICRK